MRAAGDAGIAVHSADGLTRESSLDLRCGEWHGEQKEWQMKSVELPALRQMKEWLVVHLASKVTRVMQSTYRASYGIVRVVSWRAMIFSWYWRSWVGAVLR